MDVNLGISLFCITINAIMLYATCCRKEQDEDDSDTSSVDTEDEAVPTVQDETNPDGGGEMESKEGVDIDSLKEEIGPDGGGSNPTDGDGKRSDADGDEEAHD